MCSEFYADSEKLVDVCFKTILTVIRSDNWSRDIRQPPPRCREKWFSSLAETTHVIIYGKLTKDKEKLFVSSLIFNLFTLNK